MTSNGLSYRRRVFPRPAVCKGRNPGTCPSAELELETNALIFSDTWTWQLNCELKIIEGSPLNPYAIDANVIGGTYSHPATANANTGFTAVVQDCVPNSIVTLIMAMRDIRNCSYLGVLQVVVPPNPP